MVKTGVLKIPPGNVRCLILLKISNLLVLFNIFSAINFPARAVKATPWPEYP